MEEMTFEEFSREVNNIYKKNCEVYYKLLQSAIEGIFTDLAKVPFLFLHIAISCQQNFLFLHLYHFTSPCLIFLFFLTHLRHRFLKVSPQSIHSLITFL